MRAMIRYILPVLLVLGTSSALAAGKKAGAPSLTDRERALHVLNRLTYGPRSTPNYAPAVIGCGRRQSAALNCREGKLTSH